MFFILAVAKPALISHLVVRWASVVLIVVLPMAWAMVFPRTLAPLFVGSVCLFQKAFVVLLWVSVKCRRMAELDRLTL